MTSAPPPLHHQPYSHPHPSTSGFLAPPQAHQRHYSDYDRHPAPPPEAIYGSSPGMSSHFGFDPAGQTIPTAQPYPSQHHYQPQTPRSSNPGLVPSTAAHLYRPADYHHRSSQESHRSHHSHHSRPRSSSNQSHMSHRSHHSHHSHRSDREEKRPTLGDTLMLIWDSFWGAWSPRNK